MREGIKYASHVDAFPVFFAFFFLLLPSPLYLFILCARLCVHCRTRKGGCVEIFEEIKKKDWVGEERAGERVKKMN